MHYLDNAATTAVADEVADVACRVLREHFANPSSLYAPGARSEEVIETAREAVAESLGARPGEVVFTSCGTDGDNMAVFGAAKARRAWADHIVATGYEHPAVQNAVAALEQEGWRVTLVQPDGTGCVPMQALVDAVGPKTALVTAMHMNNEVGSVLDAAALAAQVKRKNSRTFVHVDGVQAWGKLPLRLRETQIDSYAVSGHKVHARGRFVCAQRRKPCARVARRPSGARPAPWHREHGLYCRAGQGRPNAGRPGHDGGVRRAQRAAVAGPCPNRGRRAQQPAKRAPGHCQFFRARHPQRNNAAFSGGKGRVCLKRLGLRQGRGQPHAFRHGACERAHRQRRARVVFLSQHPGGCGRAFGRCGRGREKPCARAPLTARRAHADVKQKEEACMRELILAYQGEMALKGLNRATFESILVKTMRRRLKSLGDFRVYKAQSTMYAEPQDDAAAAHMDEAFERVKKIFGIAAVSRAAVCDKTFASISATAVEYLRGALSGAATFKVSAKRSDKAFPLNSMEIGRELGGVLLAAYPHLKVDVHAPQVNVTVEVRDFAAYVHAGKQPGAGGLPVSTSGKAALMLSGGIDSPVAGYMMAKRGLSLTCIHFASPPYTSERARMKVLKLAKELTPYTGNLNVYVVPYTKPQEYIRDNAPDVLFTVLMRRSMLRIANILCEKEQAKAIITGESLAQVASQTLMALACTDAAQGLPILRPCIGMDKTEITDIARRIGTFETSILPYEDCCTIFTPPHPKTKPTLAEIEAAEAAMPALAELERAAAAETPVEAVCL